jgi:dienelactone hydrolase
MTGRTMPQGRELSEDRAGLYDPFVRGPFPVGVRTILTHDEARNRQFTCEIWYPAEPQYFGQDLTPETQDAFTDPPSNQTRRQMAVRDAVGQFGGWPLIVFSHSSGGRRRQSTFLCTHLSSHGYVVAALDHSETFAPEFARKEGETLEQRAARVEGWIASRVPDVRFLIDYLLAVDPPGREFNLDPALVGIVGHSFGGWTALAAPEVEPRIRSVVALAPAGGSNPRPGIIPAKLTFSWGREVPTLYLVAENDVSLPLAGMYELFDRTPVTRHMFILRRADHLHFLDEVEHLHETFRTMPVPTKELAAMQQEMRPIAELYSGEQAHLMVRGLTLCHLDATLKQQEEAQLFIESDVVADVGKRGVEVLVHQS